MFYKLSPIRRRKDYMSPNFENKLRRSIKLMITVMILMSLYVGYIKGYVFIYYFGAFIVFINIVRLKIINLTKVNEDKGLLIESCLRNTQAILIGALTIFLYRTERFELILFSYLLTVTLSAGIISLYSEKFKIGVSYILAVATPIIIYTLIFGEYDHRIISIFMLLFLFGLFRNLKEVSNMHNELIESKVLAENYAKAKSDFLAIMSHEIRTPLNGILGMVELLKDANIDREYKKYLSIIENSSDVLETVINDILDFSKIEAGKIRLEKRPLDLKNLLNDTSQLFSPRMNEKYINFHFSYDENLPTYIKGDIVRLKQIVNNFLSNAIKFTPEDGEIVLKAHSKDGHLVISVTDSGIGMDQKQQDKLFTPFTQADMSTTRKFGGTGLGLSICKNLVELMNGSINVSSSVGRGSQFTIKLPLIEAVETLEDKSMKENKSSSFALSFPHKILLAEDNEVNKIVAKSIFKKLGYEIKIVSNGLEAVNELKINSYTIIFLDMQMPVMDGITATKEILKNKYFDGPIVALTANAMDDSREECFDAGMHDFLAKPLKINQLEKCLKQNTKLLDAKKNKAI